MQFKNNTLMIMVIIVWTVLCLGIGLGAAEAIDLFKRPASDSNRQRSATCPFHARSTSVFFGPGKESQPFGGEHQRDQKSRGDGGESPAFWF